MNKKISILMVLVALISATSIQAQKKDGFVLPDEGDIALGIDVVPLTNYLGNMFNHSTDNKYDSFGGEPILRDKKNALNPINHPNVSIMGRYMFSENWAAQFNVGFLYTYTQTNLYSQNDELLMLNPLSEAKVVDTEVDNNTGLSVALGAQYRRGYKRIQGYAGASLIYGFGENNKHYKYGNAVTEINQQPSRNFATVGLPDYWTKSYLLDQYNQGSSQYFGFGVNVGVEIFLASHFSLGGELYLCAIWQDGAPVYRRTEGFNPLNQTVEQRTDLLSPGDFKFTFGTQNLGGKLYLMFYF